MELHLRSPLPTEQAIAAVEALFAKRSVAVQRDELTLRAPQIPFFGAHTRMRHSSDNWIGLNPLLCFSSLSVSFAAAENGTGTVIRVSGSLARLWWQVGALALAAPFLSFAHPLAGVCALGFVAVHAAFVAVFVARGATQIELQKVLGAP